MGENSTQDELWKHALRVWGESKIWLSKCCTLLTVAICQMATFQGDGCQLCEVFARNTGANLACKAEETVMFSGGALRIEPRWGGWITGRNLRTLCITNLAMYELAAYPDCSIISRISLRSIAKIQTASITSRNYL